MWPDAVFAFGSDLPPRRLRVSILEIVGSTAKRSRDVSRLPRVKRQSCEQESALTAIELPSGEQWASRRVPLPSALIT